ncbi:ABC transporter permease subunit [Paraconexibacter algicola]|uniref:ABC transporter permease n=1 Tax=Paraconexibacter algicola TaxID=2133960 RepID=A0A2T4UGA1_9ACTN|nr:ABC transporter permease subunit [Paraconexibacter algicola]PTL58250.1 ABC transporter permease [Paraconexibacter algicola]
MSPATATAQPAAPPAATAGPRAIAGPTLGRLVRVELRKASDTRSGRWLLAVATLVAAVVAIAIPIAVPQEDVVLSDVVQLALLPYLVLLPIIGILLVTSEWSQRTALATFALVPDRRRVVVAKVIAALALTFAGLAIGLLAAVASTAVGGGEGAWNLSAGELGQAVLAGVINMLWGLGFGLLLRSPAAAIVAYFALPTVFTVLGELISSLRSTWDWLDLNVPFMAISELRASGDDWWQLLTAGTIWIVLPLVIGTALLLRREVK